ncbi:MAG: RpiB/LacA/LacB family sugar-phosphate isomerase, partial [Patescibacteria group bacterium]
MIYLGADHRGYELKEKLKPWLEEWNYQYEDCGAFEYNKDDDYPDFAKAVAQKVALAHEVEPRDYPRGILICGSGIGVAIAANKIKGVRAGTAASPEQIKMAVNDEDLNILCLSADFLAADIAKEIIKTFLET